AICTAFQDQFGQPLSGADLLAFIELARKHSLVQPATDTRTTTTKAPADVPPPAPPPAPACQQAPAEPAPLPQRQSLLFWRKSLFDPDRLFTRLAPRLWFLWTPAFVVLSLVGVLAAAVATSP
ncbi:MAG: hypothetical protein KY433_02640, partial [Actinobacteria bacterium]|nr:hypothetical protein [Actinomycetota bacterium]